MTTTTRTDDPPGRELDRGDWARYFEELNGRIEAGVEDLDATVEVRGEGPAGGELPLDTITFEDGDDEIAIGVGARGESPALWHFVARPRQLWVDERNGHPAVITAQSAGGTVTIVRLAPNAARGGS